MVGLSTFDLVAERAGLVLIEDDVPGEEIGGGGLFGEGCSGDGDGEGEGSGEGERDGSWARR